MTPVSEGIASETLGLEGICPSDRNIVPDEGDRLDRRKDCLS